MESEFTISCMGQKDKKYPENPELDHKAYYDCVLGEKHYFKIKLFEKKQILQLITVQQFEVSKPEARDE